MILRNFKKVKKNYHKNVKYKNIISGNIKYANGMKLMKTSVRMIDVAKKAGVSVSTVGLVLNGAGAKSRRVGQKTAEKIRKIANELNYTPNLAAQQLIRNKSAIIGVLMDPKPLEENSIRLAEIEANVRELGYHLFVMHEQPNPNRIQECINELVGRGIDGLICIHHVYPQKPAMIAELVSRNIENVVFIDEPAIANATYVGADYVEGNRQAVHYLLDKGKKRIGLVLTDIEWYAGPRIKQGYIKGLRERNKEINEKLIWISNQDIYSDLVHIEPEIANQIIDELVIEQKADALLASDDYQAAQLINCLSERGYKIPDDIAVIGNGNRYIARYTRPQLTTVEYHLPLIAKTAVDMLIEKIKKSKHSETEHHQLMIKPKLIARKSA